MVAERGFIGRGFPPRYNAQRVAPLDLSKLPTQLCPVTEATANGDHFVAEFTSGSNASETGVGLGLSGADLVLSYMGGTCGASSGGWRHMSSGGYFSPNLAFLKRWATGEADGFSYLQHCSNLGLHSAAANAHLYSMWFCFQINDAANTDTHLYSYAYNRDEKRDSVGNGEERYVMDGPTTILNSSSLGSLPMLNLNTVLSSIGSGEFWKAWGIDYKRGLLGYGIKKGEVQPAGFTDCDLYAVMSLNKIVPDGMEGYAGVPVENKVSFIPQDDLAFIGTDNTWQRCFIGNAYVPNANYAYHSYSIKSVTFSRKPFGEV